MPPTTRAPIVRDWLTPAEFVCRRGLQPPTAIHTAQRRERDQPPQFSRLDLTEHLRHA